MCRLFLCIQTFLFRLTFPLNPPLSKGDLGRLRSAEEILFFYAQVRERSRLRLVLLSNQSLLIIQGDTFECRLFLCIQNFIISASYNWRQINLRHATFSLLTTSLMQTDGVSENDWHLQRKKDFDDRYKYFSCHFLPPKSSAKTAQGEICGVVTCRR